MVLIWDWMNHGDYNGKCANNRILSKRHFLMVLVQKLRPLFNSNMTKVSVTKSSQICTRTTSNHHFHPQSAFKGPGMFWTLLSSLRLFHPTGIGCFSYIASSTGPGFFWALPASLWLFHQAGIISVSSMMPCAGQGSCLVSLMRFGIFHPPVIISV